MRGGAFDIVAMGKPLVVVQVHCPVCVTASQAEQLNERQQNLVQRPREAKVPVD